MLYCKDRKYHDYRLRKTNFLRREVYCCLNCVSSLSPEKYLEWYKKKLRYVDILNQNRGTGGFGSTGL